LQDVPGADAAHPPIEQHGRPWIASPGGEDRAPGGRPDRREASVPLAAGGIGLLVLGTQKLAQLPLVPQDTVDTMKENVQWLKEQVRPNSRATRDRQQ
jgi:hypothetical protein